MSRAGEEWAKPRERLDGVRRNMANKGFYKEKDA